MENEDILFYAFRYALGRRTHAVSTITTAIYKFADQLSPMLRGLIVTEIAEAIKAKCAGDQCDIDTWRAVADKLAQLKH